MNYIGIDPGKTGAIACIMNKGAQVYPMPESPLDLIHSLCQRPAVVYIEKQWIRPGMSACSMGSLMVHYGRLLGILECTDAFIVCVPPQTWKKYYWPDGIPDGTVNPYKYQKERSVSVAQKMGYPGRLKASWHGRAEAYLIAVYAQESHVKVG